MTATMAQSDTAVISSAQKKPDEIEQRAKAGCPWRDTAKLDQGEEHRRKPPKDLKRALPPRRTRGDEPGDGSDCGSQRPHQNGEVGASYRWLPDLGQATSRYRRSASPITSLVIV